MRTLDQNNHLRVSLGDDEPLTADGQGQTPDRREVSIRWLAGTVLTGLASTILLSVALTAALDDRETLAIPSEITFGTGRPKEGASASKTLRLTSSLTLEGGGTRRRMEVSTTHREGNKEFVRSLPFVHLMMPLIAKVRAR